MAKVPDLNSDFAQKLLHDLRRRREGLSGHQTSNAVSQDAYANSQKSFQGGYGTLQRGGGRGSRADKLHLQTGNASPAKVGKRHTKEPKGLSHDIIPFGKETQCSGNTIDMSMALALALSNSGKIQNFEVLSKAMVGGQLVTHRGAISFREPNSQYMSNRMWVGKDQYLFKYSPQIDKVSTSVQKLNEVLATYFSGGRDFRRSSIEIGRQLLKGAVDLEDSLSMLIMLQEASDCMAGSRNGQVLLLKDKDDSETSTMSNRKKSMHKSKLSFDGSSGRLVEIVDSDSHTETTKHDNKREGDVQSSYRKSSSGAGSGSNSSSHKRSLSCGPGSKPDLLVVTSAIVKKDQIREVQKCKDNSASSTNNSNKQLIAKGDNDEKARMPNVIAKLMGLEKLPITKTETENNVAQKVAKPETKTVRTPVRTTAACKLPTEVHSEREVIKRKEKLLPKEEKTSLADRKDSECTDPIPMFSEKTHRTVDKKEDGSSSSYNIHAKQIKKGVQPETIMEKRGHMSEKRAEKMIHESKKQVGENKMQKIKNGYIRRHQQASKLDDTIRKNNASVIEENSFVAEKEQTASEIQIRNEVQSSNNKTEHQNTNITKLTRTDSELKSKGRGKSSKQPSKQVVTSRDKEIIACRKDPGVNGLGNHMKSQSTMKHLGKQNRVEVDQKDIKKRPVHTETVVGYPRSREEDGVPTQVVHGIENDKASEDSHGIQEQPEAKGEEIKCQISLSNELEYGVESSNKTDEALPFPLQEQNVEAANVTTDEAVPFSLQEQNVEAANVTTTAPRDINSISDVQDYSSVVEANNGEKIDSAASAQQPPEAYVGEQESRLVNVREQSTEGSDDCENCSISVQLQEQSRDIGMHGPLTENQNLLKEILLRDQHLLDTAEAIFGVCIPREVANASDFTNNEDKLISDIMEEVMRRKGRRREAMLCPKMYLVSPKVVHLEVLIKELDDDLSSVNFADKTQHNHDDDTAQWLQRIINRDMKCGHPDVNCIWDIGWKHSAPPVQKYEVIRDMERRILNEIISELAIELIEAEPHHSYCECSA